MTMFRTNKDNPFPRATQLIEENLTRICLEPDEDIKFIVRFNSEGGSITSIDITPDFHWLSKIKVLCKLLKEKKIDCSLAMDSDLKKPMGIHITSHKEFIIALPSITPEEFQKACKVFPAETKRSSKLFQDEPKRDSDNELKDQPGVLLPPLKKPPSSCTLI